MRNRAGWTVVAVGSIALAFSFAYRNLLQVTMTTMEGDLGWSRSMLSSGATVALFAMAMGNLFGGMLVDRYGPRRLLALGLVCLGIGSLGTAFAGARWEYVLAYGAFAGAGFGLAAPTTVTSAVARFFVERRGLALGFVMSGGPIGQMTLIPLAALLLAALGWRGVFIVAGVLALLYAPVALWALRDVDKPVPGAKKASIGEDFLFFVKNPVFHLLFWGFFICGFTSIGVIEVHFVPYATFCGFTPITSANAFGVLSVLNLCGILLAGWLCDKMNRIALLAGIYFLRGLTFLMLLAITDNPAMLFAFAAIYGFVDYATMPVVASLVASHLGLRVMGFGLGMITMAHQLGAAAGAIGGGIFFDTFKGYSQLWIASLVLALIAAGLTTVIRREPAPAAA